MREDEPASRLHDEGNVFEPAPYVGLATFAGLPYVSEPADLDNLHPDVAVVGAPWDGSSWNRPGARFGPRELRAGALRPGSYHLELELDIFAQLKAVDFGDAACRHGLTDVSHVAIEDKVSELVTRGIVPIVLGGDHSITWPAANAVAGATRHGNIGLIHFDAHADTADTIEGNPRSHGTPIRRLIESGAIPGTHVVQVGLRGYWPPADTFTWMRAEGVRWHLMSDIRSRGLESIVREAVTELSAVCTGVYLSVDIDVLDPAFAPGTGTPEPGGLSTRELMEAVRLIALSTPLVGMDIVEVSPPYDHAAITVNAAQRIVMEVLAGFAARKNGAFRGRAL